MTSYAYTVYGVYGYICMFLAVATSKATGHLTELLLRPQSVDSPVHLSEHDQLGITDASHVWNRSTSGRDVLEHDTAEDSRDQWQRHQVVEPGCVCTAATSGKTFVVSE